MLDSEVTFSLSATVNITLGSNRIIAFDEICLEQLAALALPSFCTYGGPNIQHLS